MRAVVCRSHASDAGVALETVAAPAMIDGGVRIATRAIGVSFANQLVLAGKHQNTPPLPFVPGTEVAGVVLECGPGVTHVRPGDRVAAGTRSGGFAEEVVVPMATAYRLPDSVDFEAAVHFPTIYATAYSALKWRAAVQPGEVVLVHGAAGGSGLAAVEIARCLGATVIATAGSDEKLALVGRHGAQVLINHRRGPFRDAVLAATGGRGADVIYDPVGGATFDESLRCIAPDGRIIPMGFASGGIPQIPANLVLVKNITVIGLYWGYYVGWGRLPPPPGTEARVRAAFEEMFDWCARGLLQPHTWRTYPMAAFREALAAIASRDVMGRVALLP
ncbi:MAG: NADPH:quinone oxidoreductase family protein [Burkholderiaceae bacterium]|nr:NADPH:quinone oxidoreductase family protein [Burkholderiaceae bacterium]